MVKALIQSKDRQSKDGSHSLVILTCEQVLTLTRIFHILSFYHSIIHSFIHSLTRSLTPSPYLNLSDIV